MITHIHELQEEISQQLHAAELKLNELLRVNTDYWDEEALDQHNIDIEDAANERDTFTLVWNTNNAIWSKS